MGFKRNQGKMSENVKITATCKWCGIKLSPDHKGPCPKCGKEGKKISIEITENLSLKDSLQWERAREIYKSNLKMILLLIGIIVFSSLLGVIFSGLLGFLIGIFFGGISVVVGIYAFIKVREIEHGSA